MGRRNHKPHPSSTRKRYKPKNDPLVKLYQECLAEFVAVGYIAEQDYADSMSEAKEKLYSQPSTPIPSYHDIQNTIFKMSAFHIKDMDPLLSAYLDVIQQKPYYHRLVQSLQTMYDHGFFTENGQAVGIEHLPFLNDTVRVSVTKRVL